MRKGRLFGWAVVAAAAGAAVVLLRPQQHELARPTPVRGESAKGDAPPAEAKLALPPREGLSRPSRDLFASNTPPVREPARKPPVAVKAEPEIPPAPVAPPVPYRVAGQVVHDGPVQVVLARDDRRVSRARGRYAGGRLPGRIDQARTRHAGVHAARAPAPPCRRLFAGGAAGAAGAAAANRRPRRRGRFNCVGKAPRACRPEANSRWR